jgi:hypothetical protein
LRPAKKALVALIHCGILPLFRPMKFAGCLFSILIFRLFASANAGEAQDRAVAIYQDQCARCHGNHGEGVNGKYDEALQGDWSVAKLARVIAKTMPDDKDDKIPKPDAEIVAQYIHGAFYSPEARARINPVRLELAHLTNRQLINSAADLLAGFDGRDLRAVQPGGLKGTYYDSRGFNDKTKIESRLDPGVSLDFGEGMPEGVSTNEFSIQWRGSVLAEESGNYEFVVRSPNGIRLYLNNDSEPIVDGSVSSAMLVEHRASLKLIGGRAYPLRLDWFKSKDKTASVELLWKTPLGMLELIPARNLSPERSPSTFVLQTPFPADDSSSGYERGVSISKEWNEAALQAALETSAYVLDHLDRFSHSSASAADRQEKLRAFALKFMERAFRGPLTESDKARIASYFENAKPEEAVKRAVLLSMMSPRFLYPGMGAAAPDDYEIASRLSYALWDSLPDAELRKAASEGQLRTETRLAAQVKRMLADPRAKAKLASFFQDWLRLKPVSELAKDSAAYPNFTPEILSDLKTSLDLFVNQVVWSQSSDYRQLLEADYIFMNKRLASFYRLPGEFGDAFVPVRLDGEHRSGVITHPFLLTTFAYPKNTSPIHRGVFLTRKVLGRRLKPPAVAVAFNNNDFPDNLTMREKVTQLTKGESCQTCHSVINPLGFVLENFDAVGRFRESENGRAIQAAADYVTDEGERMELKNPKQVAEFALESDHARQGFIEQLFHHLVKQPVQAYAPDTIERLKKSFAASGFNIQQLAVDIVCITALHNTTQTARN